MHEDHIRKWQEHLCNHGYMVEIDGIIGYETKTSTLRYLKQMFANRNWIFPEEKGLIWIRLDQSFNNVFNDLCILYYKSRIVYIKKATTTPGNYYVYNPITYGGITGVATVSEQQVKESYQFVTSSNWKTLWLGTPYFRLTGKIKIYRDGNKDNKFDRNIITDADARTGINMHQMGKGTINYNWSAGCLGMSREDWLHIIQYFDMGDIIDLNLIEL